MEDPRSRRRRWGHRPLPAASLGWHYLSNATCLIRPHLIIVCVVDSFKDRHSLLQCLPLLKNTSVRQVVLDQWYPPDSAGGVCRPGHPSTGARRSSLADRVRRASMPRRMRSKGAPSGVSESVFTRVRSRPSAGDSAFRARPRRYVSFRGESPV